MYQVLVKPSQDQSIPKETSLSFLVMFRGHTAVDMMQFSISTCWFFSLKTQMVSTPVSRSQPPQKPLCFFSITGLLGVGDELYHLNTSITVIVSQPPHSALADVSITRGRGWAPTYVRPPWNDLKSSASWANCFSDATCFRGYYIIYDMMYINININIYIYIWCIISTSVLYIQASVFPGTCPYKVGFELCSNYVRFDVLIWRIVPHDDVLCKFWRFNWCFVLTLGTFWGLDIGDTGHWLILHII